MNKILIKNFEIHSKSVPFIIAEAGLNHNGDIEKALEMINVAKNAGADAIKFQTFKADEIVTDESLTFTYKSQGKMVTESQLELFIIRLHSLSMISVFQIGTFSNNSRNKNRIGVPVFLA